MIALEELYVLLQDMEVRERRHHIVEIDAIVPHEDVAGYLSPTLHCLYEVASRLIVRERHLALAVDVTEHNVDVRQRLHMLWRVHGEEIGKRGELLVGESLCQLIKKSYVTT